MNGIFLALLGTMATFLVTVLGSAVIFFVRNEVVIICNVVFLVLPEE